MPDKSAYYLVTQLGSGHRVAIALLTLLALHSGLLLAQIPGNTRYDSLLQTSEVRFGLRYTSDYVYMGRADSVKAPYLTPSVGYFHKSGVFIQGQLSYLTAPEAGRIDVVKFTGGYAYSTRRFTTGGAVSAYLFNDLSYAVQAEMNTYLNAYAGYDISICKIYLDAGLGLSEEADVFVGAEINRSFFMLKNALRITPSLYLNSGSQQYYDAYYTTRRQGKGGHGQSPPSDMHIAESNQFKILDYEADVLITYTIRNIRFSLSGTWAFTVNPATIITDQVISQEDLNNRFFWSAGARYALR